MRAVIIGAGNIGRGFAGRLAFEAGANIAFVDSSAPLVEALADSRSYTVTMHGERGGQMTVSGYRAYVSGDPRANDALAEPDAYAAVCVFAGALPGVAGLLASAVEKRAALHREPMNVLVMVNHPSPADELAGLIGEKRMAGLSLAECVVMCVAAPPSAKALAADPLACVNNGFSELPCDGRAIFGEPPRIAGLRLSDDFRAEKIRKLYTLNALHAVLAYEGRALGLTMAYDAISHPEVRARAEKALAESAVGLCGEFGFTPDEMAAWNARMFRLNESRELSDTLERLGADPARKLSPGERLTGAAKLCVKHGGTPAALARAMAKAEPDLRQLMAYTGLARGDALLELVAKESAAI